MTLTTKCRIWTIFQSLAHLKDGYWSLVLSFLQDLYEFLCACSLRIVSLQQLVPLLWRAPVYVLYCPAELASLVLSTFTAFRAKGI